MPDLLFCPKSPTPLLSCLIPALLSCSVPTLLFCLIFILSFYPIFALFSCSMHILLFLFYILATRLSLSALISYPEILTTLLSCFVLSQTLIHLIFLALRIFKQALSDKCLRCCSTNLTKLFCSFPTLGLLPKKSKSKQLFDMAFINSCSFIGNYITKEFDQSFTLCRYFVLVKLKRL